ncbi:MAG: E3 binding domain-containing protein, partial [Porticoccaceae bacterium]|nr:E3 binding domain-containing protein [Porticoccaceae bacterium]
LVAVGDPVEQNQPIAELETDKVAIEVVAPDCGVITELVAQVGTAIQPDQLLGRLTTDATAVTQATDKPATIVEQPPETQPANSNSDDSARHLVGPAVRKLVAEHGLNIDRIKGTGRNGRVTRDDVIEYLGSGQAEQGAPSRRVPHTQMRKSIANHMVESLLHKAPHVTSVFEMDMSNLIEHRKWHKKEYAA